MKFPIQYALLYPERVAAPFARLDLAKIRSLEFTAVDAGRFPAVELAKLEGLDAHASAVTRRLDVLRSGDSS